MAGDLGRAGRVDLVVFGILCKRPFLVVFDPHRFSFVFFAPDSLHYLAGCDRRQGRAFLSAFIEAKRRPFTAGAAGLIEDHPGRRKLDYAAPAARMRSCHSTVKQFSAAFQSRT